MLLLFRDRAIVLLLVNALLVSGCVAEREKPKYSDLVRAFPKSDSAYIVLTKDLETQVESGKIPPLGFAYVSKYLHELKHDHKIQNHNPADTILNYLCFPLIRFDLLGGRTLLAFFTSTAADCHLLNVYVTVVDSNGSRKHINRLIGNSCNHSFGPIQSKIVISKSKIFTTFAQGYWDIRNVKTLNEKYYFPVERSSISQTWSVSPEGSIVCIDSTHRVIWKQLLAGENHLRI